jgi:hypothetical protein
VRGVEIKRITRETRSDTNDAPNSGSSSIRLNGTPPLNVRNYLPEVAVYSARTFFPTEIKE